MDAFTAIFAAVEKNPAAAVLVLTLLALAWVVRVAWQNEKDNRAAEREQQAAHAKQLQEASAAHLQTAMLVTPLATKLVDCVSFFERYSARREGGA